MRQLLTIILILAALLTSCNSKSIDEVRKVKVGMSGNELKYIMGEPYIVEVNSDDEEWYFNYCMNSRKMGIAVHIEKDRIVSFYSY